MNYEVQRPARRGENVRLTEVPVFSSIKSLYKQAQKWEFCLCISRSSSYLSGAVIVATALQFSKNEKTVGGDGSS